MKKRRRVVKRRRYITERNLRLELEKRLPGALSWMAPNMAHTLYWLHLMARLEAKGRG